MAVALRLGLRNQGRTWPNPAVGCVVVQGGRVVGRGWTQEGGRPHGEVMALAQAGEAARGATAYVSLEPCAHHGRTPPCTQALIEAGVARVVTAIADPDPRVAGRGHARLRAAGIAVTEGVRRGEADWQHAGFFSKVRQGRPLVALKLAQTLDGRIATSHGESQWITGPEARARGHLLRATHDAILVGSGTVRADDPALTCRLPGLAARSPVRVVVDGKGALDPASVLVRTAGEVPVWLVTTAAGAEHAAALEAAGVMPVVVAATPSGQVDVRAAMQALGARGLTRVLVEGGAGLAAALLAADVVDRLHLFTAGRVLGGDALAAVGPLAVAALAEAPRFRHMTDDVCGDDRLQLWSRQREAACSPASSPTSAAC
ncbi:MAG: bifunctional diaminohydroxyphosphoribosylaminopyrimidine deaminase/5-amino-6-(5-phosphoribosylamino)uracil reductase RibD [Geminicoccaceae bacterium]|nr:MAG: bifunctional diaminohydroxyphosphoribosylaminopyrimidine deaminase/5-amino-6-(5-phosphoribosylamino)uracil reductase RibD [Geminicoccaceae bacterium]